MLYKLTDISKFLFYHFFVLSVVRKKKVKSVKCEGERIPGLAKVRKYRYAHKEEIAATPRSEVEDEEYILGRLLKKSLVNGAMKHDTIVDACKYINIELISV